MSSNDYKKRRKRGYDDESLNKFHNKSERQYEKEDIKNKLDEMDADFKYKKKGKKRFKSKKLEKIHKTKKQIAEYEKLLRLIGINALGLFDSSRICSYNHKLKKLNEQLKDLENSE